MLVVIAALVVFAAVGGGFHWLHVWPPETF